MAAKGDREWALPSFAEFKAVARSSEAGGVDCLTLDLKDLGVTSAWSPHGGTEDHSRGTKDDCRETEDDSGVTKDDYGRTADDSGAPGVRSLAPLWSDVLENREMYMRHFPDANTVELMMEVIHGTSSAPVVTSTLSAETQSQVNAAAHWLYNLTFSAIASSVGPRSMVVCFLLDRALQKACVSHCNVTINRRPIPELMALSELLSVGIKGILHSVSINTEQDATVSYRGSLQVDIVVVDVEAKSSRTKTRNKPRNKLRNKTLASRPARLSPANLPPAETPRPGAAGKTMAIRGEETRGMCKTQLLSEPKPSAPTCASELPTHSYHATVISIQLKSGVAQFSLSRGKPQRARFSRADVVVDGVPALRDVPLSKTLRIGDKATLHDIISHIEKDKTVRYQGKLLVNGRSWVTKPVPQDLPHLRKVRATVKRIPAQVRATVELDADMVRPETADHSGGTEDYCRETEYDYGVIEDDYGRTEDDSGAPGVRSLAPPSLEGSVAAARNSEAGGVDCLTLDLKDLHVESAWSDALEQKEKYICGLPDTNTAFHGTSAAPVMIFSAPPAEHLLQMPHMVTALLDTPLLHDMVFSATTLSVGPRSMVVSFRLGNLLQKARVSRCNVSIDGCRIQELVLLSQTLSVGVSGTLHSVSYNKEQDATVRYKGSLDVMDVVLTEVEARSSKTKARDAKTLASSSTRMSPANLPPAETPRPGAAGKTTAIRGEETRGTWKTQQLSEPKPSAPTCASELPLLSYHATVVSIKLKSGVARFTSWEKKKWARFSRADVVVGGVPALQDVPLSETLRVGDEAVVYDIRSHIEKDKNVNYRCKLWVDCGSVFAKPAPQNVPLSKMLHVGAAEVQHSVACGKEDHMGRITLNEQQRRELIKMKRKVRSTVKRTPAKVRATVELDADMVRRGTADHPGGTEDNCSETEDDYGVTEDDYGWTEDDFGAPRVHSPLPSYGAYFCKM